MNLRKSSLSLYSAFQGAVLYGMARPLTGGYARREDIRDSTVGGKATKQKAKVKGKSK